MFESLASFIHPTELGKTVTMNYLKNKDKIKQYTSDIPSDWDSSKFFESGDALGSLFTVLLGLEHA